MSIEHATCEASTGGTLGVALAVGVALGFVAGSESSEPLQPDSRTRAAAAAGTRRRITEEVTRSL
ncbi:hypothetical protein DX116_06275 [Aeromicrobium endophyticum]|uniref:Uncharacterized protein n=1 Tax=Aeromicrobium endophyticum TaxID=2292704 RepID=A0A371PC69_9ACTN|nr:hypothetical protein DX116_06275 [Aeromicrobium endophyticum]